MKLAEKLRLYDMASEKLRLYDTWRDAPLSMYQPTPEVVLVERAEIMETIVSIVEANPSILVEVSALLVSIAAYLYLF
jgi:hypothetical protein